MQSQGYQGCSQPNVSQNCHFLKHKYKINFLQVNKMVCILVTQQNIKMLVPTPSHRAW